LVVRHAEVNEVETDSLNADIRTRLRAGVGHSGSKNRGLVSRSVELLELL